LGEVEAALLSQMHQPEGRFREITELGAANFLLRAKKRIKSAVWDDSGYQEERGILGKHGL